MTKYGMLIDPNKCTGCNACRIACQMQWSLTPEMNFNWLEEHVAGQYPSLQRVIVPVQCQHCDNPPCQTVCPTGATYKRADGVVLIDSDKCIGCKYCMTACPYGARVINNEGIPEKCSFCAVHVANSKTPACVSTCMCEVRIFGDIADPHSKISKEIAYHKAINIKGTSMFYVPPKKMGTEILPPECINPAYLGVLKNISQPLSKGIIGLTAAAIATGVVTNMIVGGENKDE